MKEIDNNMKLSDYLKAIPSLMVMGTIVYFSSLSNPLPSRPEGVPVELDVNILLHIGEFAFLAFSISFGFIDKVKAKYLISFAIFFAISDEIHQYFVPNRFFDIYDVIVDVSGVILGFLVYIFLVKLKNKFVKSETLNGDKNELA